MKSIIWFFTYQVISFIAYGQNGKLDVNLVLMSGSISNKSVEHFIDVDIQKEKWFKYDDLSSSTIGCGLWLGYYLHNNLRVREGIEYFKSGVGTKSEVKGAPGTFENNHVSYVYSRFSTNFLVQYQYKVYKRFYAQLGGGVSYSYLSLRKKYGSSDPLSFGPDGIHHFVTTWNGGIRLHGGLSFKINNRWYTELSVLKDFLKPKKVSGLTMNYDLFAVEFRMGFFIL